MGNELVKQDVPMSGGLVQFQSASDALYFAEAVFKSGLAPAGFKSPQAIFVAVQQGAELGMKPMQSLQGIAVINGRTSLYDKTARGLAMASGQVESMEDRFEGSGDDFTAITTIKRKGISNPFVGKFSVADAKRAGLWGKAGPWTLYSKDMQTHKSSSRALNAGFADVLIGLPVFEDIQDSPPERKPAINDNPVDDPLMQIAAPSIREMMQHKSENPTRGNDAQQVGEREPEYHQSNNLVHGNEETSTPKYSVALSDDADYQASLDAAAQSVESVGESLPENRQSERQSSSAQVPAGANSVTGEMTVYAPKKDSKQPWNIVIAGIKMAVWPKTLPGIVKWFEAGNVGKGKKWRADYTSQPSKDPKYPANNTCVNLEVVK